MAAIPSTMLPLGTIAPDFTLLDTVSGNVKSLQELKSTLATVVMFICNHCPYVLHVNEELVRLGKEYIPKGISIIAINSNDASAYPEDAPDKMKEVAERLGYPFPYLYDESQEVAHAYNAACTPDIFLFDKELKLRYRGQLDETRPGKGVPANGRDLRNALDAIISGNEVDEQQIPSIGCNIKWRK